MNQRNRGKSTARGKGSPSRGGNFQAPKDEAEGSSIQSPQRGGFMEDRFDARGRCRNIEVRCYTCGEIGHISWEFPKRKPTDQRNANISEAREEFNEET